METGERSPYRPDYREPGAGRLASARRWAEGRPPWAWLLLWAYLAWVLVHHLGDPLYRSWFGALNLGVHELGHLLTGPLGTFLQVAAGSLVQCLAPVVSAFLFLRQGDFFAVGFAVGWLGINLFETATYAGDAAAQELPLVSPFAGVPIHDWNYLLGKLGLLDRAAGVAAIFRLGGTVCLLASLGFTAWLLLIMFRTRPADPGN